MRNRAPWLGIGLLTLACAIPAAAQSAPADPASEAQTQDTTATAAPASAAPAEAAPAAESEEPVDQGLGEVIVVTASRNEEQLQDAPATMTVLTAKDIEHIPTQNYGDLLRNVPGLNVSQMSARDIQITGRASTNSLAATELVLLDGRSLYLDFFGFVMWDFLPVNPREIKQVEVVRGPGSAIWGANAMTGVINLITKSPKEMVGTDILLGGGEIGTKYGSISHAGVSGRLGYKVSGSYYEQDAYPRPTGPVPGSSPPTVYPPYENQGTKQPKGDLRFDYDITPESTWSTSLGYAGTDGIIQSGLGPFDIDTGSSLSFFKTDWTRRALRVGFFANILRADSQNLLTRDASGRPLAFGFDTDTYNLDVSDTRVFGEHHIVSYGGNARKNSFELSIAPEAKDRDEYGVYLNDEMLLGQHARWVLGVRYDNIDPMGDAVSPRTTFIVSPNANHSFRASYNRAFRAPSAINNYLHTTILSPPVPLPTGTYFYPIPATGNPDLEAEKLDAYELSYLATFDKAIINLAVYRNESKDSADFYVSGYHTAANPPLNFPLPPIVLNIPPPRGLAGVLPDGFSYRNIGKQTDQGVEFSVNLRPTREWTVFFNYSWQDKPEVEGVPIDEVNIPPENRVNAGFGYDPGRWFFNMNANYADEAYWADVLNIRAPTDAYTMVNASVGVRLFDERMTISILGANIFDEEVQQHIFGDIITRKITGQVSFSF